MKAIIVDDEKHVREAIKLLVPWERFEITEIYEAQDGLDAARLIEVHKPQIIFTDMVMPLRGGRELLDWLQQHYPAGKTIVISGHDDFELVRHTVKSGGIDYILKPIDAEQLISAVMKASEGWHKEEAERQQQMERNIERNQFKPVYWEKMLSSLIDEPSGYEACAESLNAEFGLGPEVKECIVAVLSLDTIPLPLKAKFASNLDLLFFSLTNIAGELLKSGAEVQGIAYRYWSRENEVLLLLFRELEHAEAKLAKIQAAILAALRGTLDIGASSRCAFPSGLGTAYKEARQALRARNLLEPRKLIHRFEPDKAAATQKLLPFTEHVEAMRLAVRSGSEEQIRKVIGEWMEAVRGLDSITQEQLEHWWHEYTVVRSRWLVELFREPPPQLARPEDNSALSMPLKPDGTLSLSLWEEQLTRSLTGLSRELLTYQHQDSNVIFDIARYIQNHYHQDITLQEIASHFYLSREYISRKFKQEFGVNLSDYISGIRMDKAKLLLLNPHLRISQVAEMVGYDDEKYFSKVFKKMVGVSPNEYRKEHQP
ncbi:helix-turn-helix domain-containing protein [Paenibacillus cremeus]|uniref:Response regulator n=1 Tax=Paenibacillus cremeus TaxID=2163881 RepID=A0A559KE34_9BACL|nr:helix-turn-helix domain-containing protein [Paenibacillus cremeus]TVY10374.1 response regulator [Paenibacillus cremeus]